MKILSKLFYLLKGFFFPSACALCNGSLSGAEEIKFGLCAVCSAEIIPEQGQKCNMCGKPLISEQCACLSCRNGAEKNLDRVWVIFPYTGKYRKLLSAYKFGKNLALGKLFADKVMELIAQNPELENAGIVPVPPRAGKIKESGWDQVEYLVKQLDKKSGGRIKIYRCLKRKKSKIQKKLSRSERMENLKGRIYNYGKAPETALVIDDVITTGSTLAVCSSVLREAGCVNVYGICLFYD